MSTSPGSWRCSIQKPMQSTLQNVLIMMQSLNDYTLSVSSYVEAKDTREIVDITELNEEIKITVAKIDRLRADIDAIVAEIEGDKQ